MNNISNTTKTTMMHLRVNKAVLNDVKKLSQSMGVSMSLIGETLFKKFLEEKALNISDSYTPNKFLKNVLDEANKNRDNSKYWTEHSSIESLMTDLKN